MSAICFIGYHIGLVELICDLIGASTTEDDLVTTAAIIPVLYLIFNVFII